MNDFKLAYPRTIAPTIWLESGDGATTILDWDWTKGQPPWDLWLPLTLAWPGRHFLQYGGDPSSTKRHYHFLEMDGDVAIYREVID